MACDSWNSKLDTYLDGELSAEDARALDAHLRGCPPCAADTLNRVQLKRAVQGAGRRYAPRAEFRQRIQQMIAVRPKMSGRWNWAWATAVVAVLVIAGLALISVGRQRLRREQVFSELADLHVAALASASPVDVVSTDRHTVKPWFQGKIPFTFNLPELKESEFTLLGGRVTYLGQAPGAQLLYQIRKHQISVFIFQDRALDRPLSDTPVMKKMTFNVTTWSQDGLRYFVVGDASAEDIGGLSNLLKAAARS